MLTFAEIQREYGVNYANAVMIQKLEMRLQVCKDQHSQTVHYGEYQKECLELRAQVVRLRGALEIIAGLQQCGDNLMSNAEIAAAALNRPS